MVAVVQLVVVGVAVIGLNHGLCHMTRWSEGRSGHRLVNPFGDGCSNNKGENAVESCGDADVRPHQRFVGCDCGDCQCVNLGVELELNLGKLGRG